MQPFIDVGSNTTNVASFIPINPTPPTHFTNAIRSKLTVAPISKSRSFTASLQQIFQPLSRPLMQPHGVRLKSGRIPVQNLQEPKLATSVPSVRRKSHIKQHRNHRITLRRSQSVDSNVKPRPDGSLKRTISEFNRLVRDYWTPAAYTSLTSDKYFAQPTGNVTALRTRYEAVRKQFRSKLNKPATLQARPFYSQQNSIEDAGSARFSPLTQSDDGLFGHLHSRSCENILCTVRHVQKSQSAVVANASAPSKPKRRQSKSRRDNHATKNRSERLLSGSCGSLPQLTRTGSTGQMTRYRAPRHDNYLTFHGTMQRSMVMNFNAYNALRYPATDESDLDASYASRDDDDDGNKSDISSVASITSASSLHEEDETVADIDVVTPKVVINNAQLSPYRNQLYPMRNIQPAVRAVVQPPPRRSHRSDSLTRLQSADFSQYFLTPAKQPKQRPNSSRTVPHSRTVSPVASPMHSRAGTPTLFDAAGNSYDRTRRPSNYTIGYQRSAVPIKPYQTFGSLGTVTAAGSVAPVIPSVGTTLTNNPSQYNSCGPSGLTTLTPFKLNTHASIPDLSLLSLHSSQSQSQTTLVVSASSALIGTMPLSSPLASTVWQKPLVRHLVFKDEIVLLDTKSLKSKQKQNTLHPFHRNRIRYSL